MVWMRSRSFLSSSRNARWTFLSDGLPPLRFDGQGCPSFSRLIVASDGAPLVDQDKVTEASTEASTVKEIPSAMALSDRSPTFFAESRIL